LICFPWKAFKQQQQQILSSALQTMLYILIIFIIFFHTFDDIKMESKKKKKLRKLQNTISDDISADSAKEKCTDSDGWNFNLITARMVTHGKN
jgi:hypothetical protein